MTSPAPRLQNNQIVELAVTGLAFGGKGVARVDDFVVFVTGAVPGDVVRARLTKYKKRYAEARVEELISASPDRRLARCPAFGACGGCVWQDLDYAAQLEYKAAQVRESLEHLGGLKDFDMRGTLGMASPWRYRNRADFSIGTLDGEPVVGFRPRGRWDSVLPLTECHLLDPVIEGIRATVQDWLRQNGLPGWEPRTGSGMCRHLLVRSSQGGAEALVSLATAAERLPGAEGLVERLCAVHPQVVGIIHAVNQGRAEVSAGLPSETLWGRPFLLERLAGLTLKVSLDAFFQTNTLMAHALYGLVVEEAVGRTTCAAHPAGPVVWDLYSGVGSIGSALARRATAVLAVEAVPAAVSDARENARLNSVGNIHFVEGDVARVLREVSDGTRPLPKAVEKPDVIVVDPPRAGLGTKAVKRIAEVGAPRIVYVSCNPSTMAPDVAGLVQYGYRLESVTPVDMFPHTPHVECVASISRA